MRNPLTWIPRLWANWITLFGSVLATVSAVGLLLFIALDLLAPGRNPYASSLFVLFLPMLFVFGLAVIPVGFWVERRQKHPAKGAVEAAFETAIKDPSARNRILFVAVLTLANVLLLGMAAKSSVEYMDSPKFCGGACHQVMQPEWSAYQKSPHANINCDECHISGGMGSYVGAKVNGIGQMVKLFTNTYHRPIPTPLAHLSSETCTRCHSKKVIGDRLKVYPHFRPDKDNSPAYNVFVLRVGGGGHGIHRHADRDIRYQFLDEKRSRIGKVTVRENGKVVAEYLPPGEPAKSAGERQMDCVDCHNRPTHIFDASPKAAIDLALADGRLDAKIPFVAQVGAELLQRPDGRRADAVATFRGALADAFRQRQVAVSGSDLDRTAKALAEIYRVNVYPELNLGWGTYRSNLGHDGDGGCFRCHDNQHAAKLADGSVKTLSQDCDSCHERVAADEDPKNLDDTTQLLLPKKD